MMSRHEFINSCANGSTL